VTLSVDLDRSGGLYVEGNGGEYDGTATAAAWIADSI
jgi:hypothetical protein